MLSPARSAGRRQSTRSCSGSAKSSAVTMPAMWPNTPVVGQQRPQKCLLGGVVLGRLPRAAVVEHAHDLTPISRPASLHRQVLLQDNRQRGPRVLHEPKSVVIFVLGNSFPDLIAIAIVLICDIKA